MANESEKNIATAEESRRRFVKTAGKLALYTPPAMVLLMQPSRNAIAQSPGCNNGVGNGPDCLPRGLQNNGKSFLDNDDAGGTPGNPQNRGGAQ